MMDTNKIINNDLNLDDSDSKDEELEQLSAKQEDLDVDSDFNLIQNVKEFLNNTENDFGNYSVIYNEKNKSTDEKYSKLIEDAKISKHKHIVDNEILNKLDDISKFELERNKLSDEFYYNDQTINISYIRSLIESSLYIAGGNGIAINDIRKIVNLPIKLLNLIIDEMIEYYKKNENSGLLLVHYGNKYKFVTKPIYNDKIGIILNQKTKKPLSDSIMETLSIIAYNQPCTKTTIEKIRDKDSTNAIARLVELDLISADAKSDAIGKPWLYTVTQKFFDLFGIKSLSELPILNRDMKNYDENNQNLDSDEQYVDYE